MDLLLSVGIAVGVIILVALIVKLSLKPKESNQQSKVSSISNNIKKENSLNDNDNNINDKDKESIRMLIKVMIIAFGEQGGCQNPWLSGSATWHRILDPFPQFFG